jgi:NAD-dependent dihydropyrimidine dehydrogenase PreA subunit
MKKGIVIDEFKCNGCGLCVEACHEGALALVNGKAKLVREDFCDGLGDCLPVCPTGAISFIELCGCEKPQVIMPGMSASPAPVNDIPAGPGSSELRQWPIKVRLVSAASPIFNNADVLLAADCSAFSYAGMHEDLIKGRAIMIGCPKFEAGLDEKISQILAGNNIKSLTVVRMTVPCCSIDRVARDAVAGSGKGIPMKVLTFDQRGCLVKES